MSVLASSLASMGSQEGLVGVWGVGDGLFHLLGGGGVIAVFGSDAGLGQMAEPVIGIFLGDLRIDLEGALGVAGAL